MSVAYDLDIVGILEGTDKSSAIALSWDYLRKYQALFAHLRDEEFNLIEIGVLGGSSARVWKSFFHKATIVGIDINPLTARQAEDRVKIEIGSQEDPAFLARVCAKYPPTIVIDDGSHLAHHVIYTFERVYPSLLPGGFYVVEDMAFHWGSRASQWRKFDGFSPIDYFGEIIKSRMARNLPADPPAWGTQRHVFDSTDSVTVIDSAVILQKRPQKPAIEAAEAFAAEQLATKSYDSAAYSRLAEYYQRNWPGSAQAEQAGRKALEMNPGNPAALQWLGNFLSDKGRREEAVGLFETAIAAYSAAIKAGHSRDAKLGAHHREISMILDRLGRPAEALTHAEEAVRLVPEGHDWRPAYLHHLEGMRAKAARAR